LFKRLSEKESTGALHAFTPKESANIFFKEGIIIGAAKGLVEGEEVLRQVMDWKDARFIWQPESQPGATISKPLEIEFDDFLVRAKAAPKLEIAGKILSPDPSGAPAKAASGESAAKGGSEAKTGAPEAPVPPLKPASVEKAPVFINMSSKAATTGRVEVPAAAVEEPIPVASGSGLTATKSINSSSPGRITREESLLQRFPLALVSLAEPPGPRLKITRVSSLIGRNPACDFVIDHGSISRQHCLLQITDRGLHVKDLGTTNGTKVNGIVLKEGYINIGDKLTVGHLAFILEGEKG